MNRKLQRSATALSATAAVFGLLLFAGGPPQPAVSATVVASDNIDMAADEISDVDTAATTATSTGSHRRRSRAALALPYFSFAQGLRRVTGS